MPKSLEGRRIEALEAALLEYVGRYGLTELAKKAFTVTSKSNVVTPKKRPDQSGGGGINEASDK